MTGSICQDKLTIVEEEPACTEALAGRNADIAGITLIPYAYGMMRMAIAPRSDREKDWDNHRIQDGDI